MAEDLLDCWDRYDGWNLRIQLGNCTIDRVSTGRQDPYATDDDLIGRQDACATDDLN
jgi:hypothetical protein